MKFSILLVSADHRDSVYAEIWTVHPTKAYEEHLICELYHDSEGNFFVEFLPKKQILSNVPLDALIDAMNKARERLTPLPDQPS